MDVPAMERNTVGDTELEAITEVIERVTRVFTGTATKADSVESIFDVARTARFKETT